jgi:N-acetylglucosamine-6-phosphate deacetylase
VTDFWLSNGRPIASRGILEGAVRVRDGCIAAIRSRAPRGLRTVNLRGAYLAPGFIDLHVWGEPARVSRAAARGGATAFLTALGPEPAGALIRDVGERGAAVALPGAACVGLHLEGPFLNPARGGALPKRAMRPPTAAELSRLWRVGRGRIRLVTLAPELPGALEAIRWCRRRRIVASLGHSVADAAVASRAVDAGAQAVTHVFNGMQPFHHRQPALLDVALTDPRLTTMVILDGVHVSPWAFRLLVRAKGTERIALVTDSIRHQGWLATRRHGAFYLKDGTLAGSALTMMEAVRNAVRFADVSIADAVRMATETPARLLGDRSRGTLEVGRRADLVAFDRQFRVLVTIVGGRVVYQR